MLRYNFDQGDEADLVEQAVNMALESKRTAILWRRVASRREPKV